MKQHNLGNHLRVTESKNNLESKVMKLLWAVKISCQFHITDVNSNVSIRFKKTFYISLFCKVPLLWNLPNMFSSSGNNPTLPWKFMGYSWRIPWITRFYFAYHKISFKKKVFKKECTAFLDHLWRILSGTMRNILYIKGLSRSFAFIFW